MEGRMEDQFCAVCLGKTLRRPERSVSWGTCALRAETIETSR